MTAPPTIARLSGGGRIWALGALLGDDDALETLARAVLSRWQPGDRLVVLGNMLGPNGDPAGTLDGLLRLRRRLMAANRSCGILFLRGAGQRRRSAAVGRRRGCHAAPRRTGRRLFWWSAQSDVPLAAGCVLHNACGSAPGNAATNVTVDIPASASIWRMSSA